MPGMPPLAAQPARALLLHANQIARRIRIALEVAPAVIGRADAGLEQQTVRVRRGLGQLRDAQRLVLTQPARLRRHARGIGDAVVVPSHVRQTTCSSQKPPILCLAVACQVMRPLMFSHLRSVNCG